MNKRQKVFTEESEMDNKKTNFVLPVILLLISVFLAAGVNMFFHACIHEDGSTGSCHWAQQAIFAAGIILCIQSLILLIFRERTASSAISFSILGTAVITALIPNVFIKLCMMPSMHCLAYMRPWTIICCVVIAAMSIVNIVFLLRKQPEKRRL